LSKSRHLACYGLLFSSTLLLLDAVDGIVARQLKAARKWLTLQQFLDYLIWALLAGLGLLAAGRMIVSRLPNPTVWAVLAIAVPLGAAFLASLLRWSSSSAVARELDARAHTKDRFITVLGLAKYEASALVQAARQEASAFAATVPVAELLRPRLPWKRSFWLLIPIVAFGIIEGVREWRAGQLGPELERASELLEQARQAAARHAEKDKEFHQIVEELKQSEEQLASSSEPLREALRTLAALEEKLAQPSELTAAERNALANALAQDHAELAASLRAARNQEAAEEAAQLDPAELAKALEQAARHLESRRLRDLAQDAQSAQVQLGVLLGASGGAGNEQGRRRFVTALREIKSGTPAASPDGGQDGMGINLSQNGQNPSASSPDESQATGAPGSELDLGRGKVLDQEAELLAHPEGSEDFLEGKHGEGSSLVQLFRASGGDDPKARRAYRSAYQVAAPAGSRLLVRRYFDSIRPKE
jgi:phosphatidylglycerophosphate synthase